VKTRGDGRLATLVRRAELYLSFRACCWSRRKSWRMAAEQLRRED
jgi:hypothetical protein